MSKRLGRWALGLALVIGGGVAGVKLAAPHPAQAEPAKKSQGTEVAVAPQAPARTAQAAVEGEQYANVDEMKAAAFKALRAGQFDRTNTLLTKAAAANAGDSKLVQMAEWSQKFESQRQAFAAERHKQFDKAVEDIKKLMKANRSDYALDYVARAYLLADDKKAFRNEKWVDDLINQTIESARKHEANEQWLKALRLYSDLGSVEPAKPEWKEKLKTATRRIRLLAMYNVEEFKKIQEAESSEREAVDAIVKPATQPTSKPTSKPADERDDSFRTDWRQTLRDIQPEMLQEALEDARNNYYRDTSYRDLGLGGIKTLRLLVTTKGLEAAFPGLKDAAGKTEFLGKLDTWGEKLRNAAVASERYTLQKAVLDIRDSNQNTVKIPEEVLVNEFADGAFAELDPFTSMIWPYDYEEFKKTTDGEFSGVGIQIQSDDDGSLKVVSPLEDSPGYRAGIKAGDVITKINGKNAKGISINQAVKNITGKSGTKVTLTIRSQDGTSRDVTITRQTIKVASVKGWRHRPGGGWDFFVDPDNKIGYIRLTNFTKLTKGELDAAVNDMQREGVRGLILDLRYNPGGLLTAATEVSDKFLSGGVIVSTKADRETPNQPTEAHARVDEDDVRDLPLVVLVNQYSASASEIVSGALKDQKRAMIVGERTFGKGSVQMLFPVARERSGRPIAFLKLTTSHYYLPNGKCIHREENSTEWGVDPHVTVEMTPEQMRAAIDARQELDVLRNADDGDKPAGEKPAPRPEAGKGGKEGAAKKDPLSQDAQLSAALLLLRFQTAGASVTP